ncbi:MAG: PQQ-binding-like beta-propeller repeat protein [Planctomycetota bacterium]
MQGTIRTLATCLLVTSASLMSCKVTFAGNWTQFRGTDSSGVANTEKLPTKWSNKENIAWQQKLPGRGLSSPIVVGDKVYVTASSGPLQDRLHVLCFDAGSGKQIWERQFWSTGNTTCHPKTCIAAPTPASDGERIFAFFSTNDMACLDLDGNLLWYRGLTHDYPNASNSVGMSSSPVVVGDTVVVQVECQAESFAAGLDVKTGENRWRIPRPKNANWSSPIALRVGNDPDGAPNAVLLQSSEDLRACDPKTGKPLWIHPTKCSSIPSCAKDGDVLFVPAGGLTAFQLAGGDKEPTVVWKEQRLGASTASPLVYNGRVYTLNGAGVLNAADAKTGEIVWKLRLKGPFSATPVVADGLLYFFNEEGLGQVVKPGDKEGEIIATSTLGEVILCTPAIANQSLFIRSDGHLWKISKT